MPFLFALSSNTIHYQHLIDTDCYFPGTNRKCEKYCEKELVSECTEEMKWPLEHKYAALSAQ